MTIQEFFETMADESISSYEGDGIYLGLVVMSRYIDPLKHPLVLSSGHDEICSVDAIDLVNAGITEKEVLELKKYGWEIVDSEVPYLKHPV